MGLTNDKVVDLLALVRKAADVIAVVVTGMKAGRFFLSGVAETLRAEERSSGDRRFGISAERYELLITILNDTLDDIAWWSAGEPS